MLLTQEILTGDVKVEEGDAVLSVGALGSCIAVVAFDVISRRGGIAHVMLPGKARETQGSKKWRYAEDAIQQLIGTMRQNGTDLPNIRVFLAGAGNVLRRPDDTVCIGNICSVRNTLAAMGLVPAAESLGGLERRRVRLTLPSGRVECAVGDGAFFHLFADVDNSIS